MNIYILPNEMMILDGEIVDEYNVPIIRFYNNRISCGKETPYKWIISTRWNVAFSTE